MSHSEPKVTTVPHVVKEELMAAGKWVKLEETTYVDPAGNTRTWESVKRTTRQTNTEADGVGIIALLKRTLHKDCVVMVKQFRPPLGCSTLEFPAGLIDEGETAEAAALRELKEETGYKGEVVGVTPVTCLDPGLSNCTTQIILVNINGDEAENIHPTQQLGEGEFVEVVLLPLDEFQTKIDDLLKKEKIMVDAKVYIFAMGMVQAFFKPRELPVLKQ
ncbi:ADP-sugar pyrophosphatase [Anabas testudineus]|uniref:ADP-sugar pyrophosphatase n=1 Tax=Anabas testudineus TaxID=64144 RepID=A0A7N6AJF7_ANATE|nr:ADP-sugar pyrophosphatase [Anabas testudineus]XP_026219633.1 ADP-sugar pyrophosphatase [Anabas testudineus]XP_026219634.1 ADP-sugar pyrophosphatase [Anabas testudineus]